MTSPHDGVHASGLGKRFGDLWALRDVDLDVPPGTVLGLLGHNGAGKTTAVRILTTLSRPTEGSATVAGIDVAERPEAVRPLIGLAGQSASVDGLLSARRNLELAGRLYHLPKGEIRDRADELLARVGLTDKADDLAKTFSGGMRRRLDLAASLIAKPPVLFLDEPTTGLDPQSRIDLWALLRELVAEGATLLLTTQYLEEADRLADRLADRVAVLDGGAVVATGSADELKRRLGTEQVELVLDGPAAPAVALLGDAVVRSGAGTVWVATDGSAAHLRHVLDTLAGGGVGVATATPRRPTLDDVFLTLTGSTRTRPDPTGPAATLEGASR